MQNKYRKLLQKEAPNLYKNYEEIVEEQFELFAKKQLDYGISNISTGANLETKEGKDFALLSFNKLKKLDFVPWDFSAISYHYYDEVKNLQILPQKK